MEFSEAIAKIESILKSIGSDISGNEYDGLIVKKLESSNTLDDGRSTNQTHIAITGNQMDMFPYVRADGYFEVEYNKEDVTLKKYFIAQIPVYIHKENVGYLEENAQLFAGEEQLVHISIVRSRRNNAADQIQMSMTNIDSPVYVKYRKLVHAKTYMILLKRKQKLMYDLYSVKETDGDSVLKELNNGFYKLSTNTPVKLDEIIVDEESGKWYMEQLPQSFLWERIPEAFHTSFAKRYVTSLLAKPFVILTGNSGTGKTRISKQFSEYLETYSDDGKKNWVLVPVGADWTDNTKILGFYNPLANEGKGNYEKTEILQIIEEANANPNKPYFIILDEMNLSHVERYFADFLSHMETENIPFVLDGYDGCLAYPSNVFVVGTVNIDETTYMFSPKVLDRANVIEFKPDENSVLDLFLNPAKSNDIPVAEYGIAEAFLNTAKKVRNGECNLEKETLEEVQRLFRKIYKITEKYGYEFAFRSVKEIRQYIVAAYELLENKTDFNLIAAEDEQLLQKILPKIHGNKKEIGQLLEELDALCSQEQLQLSGEKIKQMKGKLAAVQYASFI